jgi:uncharacterized membrane protein
MDVTKYEVLLFAHILFVSIWVGGDAMIQVFWMRAVAAGPERKVQLMKDVEWIGQRVLTPSALLVAAFGVWLVLDSPAWEFSQFFVSFGLAVFVASFVAGAGFLGPEAGRIGRLGDERPVDDPELQARIERVLLISRIELVLLILVIFSMTAKPFLGT